jgi:hypothetical protein
MSQRNSNASLSRLKIPSQNYEDTKDDQSTPPEKSKFSPQAHPKNEKPLNIDTESPQRKNARLYMQMKQQQEMEDHQDRKLKLEDLDDDTAEMILK